MVTFQVDPDWNALIDDVMTRNMIVDVRSPRDADRAIEQGVLKSMHFFFRTLL